MNKGENLILSNEQQEALNEMLKGSNVFLTGKAGTGKSMVVNKFLAQSDKCVVSLAMSGQASQNISGQTIHSFFKLPICVMTPEIIQHYTHSKSEILQAVDVILIDEVSMLRQDVFMAMDYALRKYASPVLKKLPFGGAQIICVGDPYQLPPVLASSESEKYFACYDELFVFKSKVWDNANLKMFNLQKIFRQTDENEINILNGIREGHFNYCESYDYYRNMSLEPDSFDKSYIAKLNKLCDLFRPSILTPLATIICLTNKRAKVINKRRLALLSSEEFIFKAKHEGIFDEEAKVVENEVILKIGAKVMLRHNKRSDDGCVEYVNGDVGFIDCITDYRDDPIVIVRLLDGRHVAVKRHSWIQHEYDVKTNSYGKKYLVKNEIGSFSQIPLTPAYAITVHKAQGLTLDQVHLDFGNCFCFCAGQLYVALSRVRSLRKLTLSRPVTDLDVIIDPKAKSFMERFRAARS